MLLDPGAIDHHHTAAAVGAGGADHQIEDAVVIDIGHQHRLAELLAPAGTGVGADQQAADTAGVAGGIEQGQVGRIGRERALRQGVEPGGRGLGGRAAGHTVLRLAGVLNPDPARRGQAGRAGKGLGDGQPAVAVAPAVGEAADHLGCAETDQRCGEGGIVRGRRAVGAAQRQAIVEVLQLRRGLIAQHRGGDHGIAVAAVWLPPGTAGGGSARQAGSGIEHPAENRHVDAGAPEQPHGLVTADAVTAAAGGGREGREDRGDEGARGHPLAAELIAHLEAAAQAGDGEHRAGDAALQAAVAGRQRGEALEDGERGRGFEGLAEVEGVGAAALAGAVGRAHGGDHGARQQARPGELITHGQGAAQAGDRQRGAADRAQQRAETGGEAEAGAGGIAIAQQRIRLGAGGLRQLIGTDPQGQGRRVGGHPIAQGGVAGSGQTLQLLQGALAEEHLVGPELQGHRRGPIDIGVDQGDAHPAEQLVAGVEGLHGRARGAARLPDGLAPAVDRHSDHQAFLNRGTVAAEGRRAGQRLRQGAERRGRGPAATGGIEGRGVGGQRRRSGSDVACGVVLADRTGDGAQGGGLTGERDPHRGQQLEGIGTAGHGPLAGAAAGGGRQGERLVIEGQLIDRTATVVGQQHGLIIEIEGQWRVGHRLAGHQLVVHHQRGDTAAAIALAQSTALAAGDGVRQVGGDDVVPLAVSQVVRHAAHRPGEQRAPLAEIELQLAVTGHRDSDAVHQREAERIAAVGLAAGGGRPAVEGVGGGVEGELHLGLAGAALVIPQHLKQLAEGGVGWAAGLQRAPQHQPLVEHRRIRIEADGTEAGVRLLACARLLADKTA